jgi:hypothetical protein
LGYLAVFHSFNKDGVEIEKKLEEKNWWFSVDQWLATIQYSANPNICVSNAWRQFVL